MTDDQPVRPRLPLLTDEELAARGFAPTGGEFVRVFGHAADAFRRWSAWYAPIIADGAVESRLKEICRMRVAQLNDCAVWQAARIPLSGGTRLEEETVAQIARWADGDFADREKAALGFTERLYVDHQHIDQELFDDMARHFTPEQIVELSWAIVSYMGYGRLIHSFGLTPGEHL